MRSQTKRLYIYFNIENFYHLCFTVLFLFVAVLRAKYTFAESLWPDEALYAWNAQRIFENPSLIFSKEIVEFHPSLFSVLLALGHIFFPPLLACQIISLFIGLAGIVAIYSLGLRLNNNPFLGLFAALLFAFHPISWIISSKILTDNPLVFLLIILASQLISLETTSSVKKDILVGLTVSLIILTKWAGVVVVPWFIIYYFLVFQEIGIAERIKK